MDDSLLLVIPKVVAKGANGILVDEHFGNNLEAYLSSFGRVTVACPAMPAHDNMVSFKNIKGNERCRIVVLPESYREDRYFLNYRRIRKLLESLIDTADYLLLSPHAALDWSTLATRIALTKGRDYNMEGDWDLQNVVRSQLRQIPFGPMKLRRTLWYLVHQRYYLDSMRGSRLALLQGAAVFAAYKEIAPNPFKVFNVQVTPEDRISDDQFARRLANVRAGGALRIAYAGRAIAMKGSTDWLRALKHSFDKGLNAEALWLGDGELLETVRSSAQIQGLSDKVKYPGSVSREEAFNALRAADIFLFCHMTDESPRCLIEALTAALPIVGYDSLYAADLVAERGGGELVELGDWQALANRLLELDRDRERLARLMQAARQSSLLYERDAAISHRIALMRTHLRPKRNLNVSTDPELTAPITGNSLFGVAKR